MYRLQRLKTVARHAAKFRGHNLSKFTNYSSGSAMAICKNDGCYDFVRVNPKPLPNQIAISGTATALECEHKNG